MRYAIVIEKAEGNYSAYVPDLPGCIATGDTVAEVEREIRDAIRFRSIIKSPALHRRLHRT
jgi:predicted RNase H-like HicB family nuclease